VTLISAPSAQTASTALPATNDSAEAGSFASVLKGVLQADASAGVPIRPDAATGGQDVSASATAVAPMSWPTGQSVPDGASGQAGTEVPGTTDADAPADAPAIVAGTVLEVTATALLIAPNSAAPTAEAGTTAETTTPPAPAMSPAPSPFAGTPAGDSTGLLDTAAQTPATETVATMPPEPIANPAPAAPSPSVPPASVQNPSAPGTTAPDADLQTPQPATGVPATPAPSSTRGAAPGAITPSTTAANSQAGSPTPASHPAEAPTPVHAPALVGSQPAAAEPAAPAAVPAVSSPMPTTPAATTASPSAPAPAASAAPAQPLNTQLAQPLFSLAGARTGEHVMTVQVTPENLGPVTVRAVISADDIRIELFSPSDGGRDALRQILTDLRRDLAGGGLAASLDLSSKNERGSSEERTPLREAPRPGAAAPEPVIEQRSAPASTVTTTLDVTV
jgi:flagellar hook-length control protein FliK